MKPGFLFVTASFMMLISVEPQATHANGDPRVGKLISQSGAALHVDALRSMKVIHAKGSVVATGLSGSRTERDRSISLSTPAERTSSIRQSLRSLAWPAVDRQRSQAWAAQVLPLVSR